MILTEDVILLFITVQDLTNQTCAYMSSEWNFLRMVSYHLLEYIQSYKA